MICVISQPRFFPGLHYLHRMMVADVFVVLDTVDWQGPGKGYKGGIDEMQLEWLANDLSHVPDDRLIVLMMHIPLAKVHSMFSLVSCLFPMCLSLKAKYYIYERTNDVIASIFFWDMDAKNHVVKPVELCYERKDLMDEFDIILNRDEQTSQEAAVYATICWLGLYFALTINYLLSVFGQEIIVSKLD